MAIVDDVANRFRFHPATAETGPKHDNVRQVYEDMARYIMSTVPTGRHQSLAITSLQESMMWCNAGIACDS